MLKLPIGIQSFETLRKEGYLYVDKTKYIYDLITNGQVYFLSRPRRFGKSLTISTFENLFRGNKDLFKGLYIYDKWDWNNKYPIIKLDMSNINMDLSQFNNSLSFNLTYYTAKAENIEVPASIQNSPPDIFAYLIVELSKKYQKQVVVLIDEYDKPILEYITNPEKVDKIRNTLANFYGVLKPNDKYIKFLFITGVSKFSKVSIFSKLNNLEDLTLVDRYSAFLGYTQNELEQYLNEYIEQFAKRKNISYKRTLQLLKLWYDGYNFDGKENVYNPFSILNAFKHNELRPYWFESGTPSFLIDYIKEKGGIPKITEAEIRYEDFSAKEIEDAQLPIFLYQAGYFTIKKKWQDGWITHYKLGFPNLEVQLGFSSNLIRYGLEISDDNLKNIKDAYINANWNKFVEYTKATLASISYNVLETFTKEAHYQALIYMLYLTIFGNVKNEEETTHGRSDIVIDYKDTIVIIELKLNESTKKALKQIQQKEYYTKYKGKKVILIGINIDSEKRNITEWEIGGIKNS